LDGLGQRVTTLVGADKARSYSGEYMRLAQQGEALVFDYLERHYGRYPVYDHRDDPSYRRKDIDFGYNNGGGARTVEVKTDTRMRETGNFFFEVQRIYLDCPSDEACYKGWGWRTEADEVWVVDSLTRPQAHLFYSSQLRSDVQQYLIGEASPRLSLVPTDRTTRTIGLLIPLTALHIRATHDLREA